MLVYLLPSHLLSVLGLSLFQTEGKPPCWAKGLLGQDTLGNLDPAGALPTP